MKHVDFKEIYEKNYRRCFLFALSYLHDEMDAEDVASDSIVKYWEVLRRDETTASPALLLTIIKNRSLNCLRNKRLHQDIITNVSESYDREIDIRINTLESCDPQEIFSIEIHKIIAQTIKSLPPLTQQIFEISRDDCLSVKEIALAKRLSEKGVEYHITKALKALRIALKDYLPLFFFLIS